MPVTQDDSALSRGRIPSYLHRQANFLLSLLLEDRARRSRMLTRLLLLSRDKLFFYMKYNRRRSLTILLNSLMQALHYHYTSYDMVVRPTVLFNQPPLSDPIAELPSTEFYEMSGF
jgi:hypothetical protein